MNDINAYFSGRGTAQTQVCANAHRRKIHLVRVSSKQARGGLRIDKLKAGEIPLDKLSNQGGVCRNGRRDGGGK